MQEKSRRGKKEEKRKGTSERNKKKKILLQRTVIPSLLAVSWLESKQETGRLPLNKAYTD
ncbi:hypothetical protein EYF80_030113 [Liparis tanakae]|uniref:Uncharacterized protein n=1 Tax=Liparis tanakae TaxID=230148 RepID=A0A4Z2H167_9TELE|nr:hypothetical protein EYF80_030113 [Liparis tanakae]